MTSELELSHVGFSYGTRPVLDDVSFSIEKGTCLGLVGESGSGKSTLARLVLGMRKAQTGAVTVTDSRPNAVQMVFQDPRSSLNPHRKIADIVAEPLTINKTGTKESRRTEAFSRLREVGIDPEKYADVYPSVLSGGQAQRVAIARALAASPSLLVCDEPVSALDVSVQAKVLNLLADLRDNGLTMLFITHDLAVVRMISDRVAVLDKGRIVELGPTEEIIKNPQDPYTKTLVNASPRMPTRPEMNAPQEGDTL